MSATTKHPAQLRPVQALTAAAAVFGQSGPLLRRYVLCNLAIEPMERPDNVHAHHLRGAECCPSTRMQYVWDEQQTFSTKVGHPTQEAGGRIYLKQKVRQSQISRTATPVVMVIGTKVANGNSGGVLVLAIEAERYRYG